jgi:hypothetical protein
VCRLEQGKRAFRPSTTNRSRFSDDVELVPADHHRTPIIDQSMKN